MAYWPCQQGYSCGGGGGDDGTGRYWVPGLHYNRIVLFRIWVEISSTGGLLCLKGTGGIAIPYKGYIEANLIISGLAWYNEAVLFLVISDNKYGYRVPVQLGTLIIDHLVVTSDYGRITADWRYLETGIPKSCDFKKE